MKNFLKKIGILIIGTAIILGILYLLIETDTAPNGGLDYLFKVALPGVLSSGGEVLDAIGFVLYAILAAGLFCLIKFFKNEKEDQYM